jgi:hypothetical protein
MKKYEEQQVSTTRTILVGEFCDWCGVEIPAPARFDARSFTLSFAKGQNFSEGGHDEGWAVEDLCDGCIEKLRLLLLDAGVKITPTEADW